MKFLEQKPIEVFGIYFEEKKVAMQEKRCVQMNDYFHTNA